MSLEETSTGTPQERVDAEHGMNSVVGRFKSEAEALLRDRRAALCVESRSPIFRAIILRFPADIYLPTDLDVGIPAGIVATLVHNAVRGMPLPISEKDGRVNLLHSEDAVQSIARAISLLIQGKYLSLSF